jgi:hypothetical protein
MSDLFNANRAINELLDTQVTDGNAIIGITDKKPFDQALPGLMIFCVCDCAGAQRHLPEKGLQRVSSQTHMQ